MLIDSDTGAARHARRPEAPDHLPRLDGLRALAVFGVILFHAEYFRVGWIGVQVFFVLSGFLITRILVASRQKYAPRPAAASPGQAGEFFLRFYWRRTLRIFPLYFGYLLVLAVTFSLSGWPPFFTEACPWLFTYTVNFARLSPEWQHSHAYEHLWSLAVEEQFYLLWPAVVWFLSEQKLRRLIVAMIVIAPLLRFGVAQVLTGWSASAEPVRVGIGVYSLLTSHLDAFGVGAGLAIGLPFLTERPLAKLLACLAGLLVAGLLMLHTLRGSGLTGWSSFGFPHTLAWHHQYVWGYTLLNFASIWFIALLIVPSASGGPLQILENPVLAYLGKISYGLYVWHAPVQAIIADAFHMRHFKPIGIPALLISTAITIALAAASFHLFENWFLKLKNLRPWATRFVPPHQTPLSS